MTSQVAITRQTVLAAEREIDFQDFVSGVAKPIIFLKAGTRILRGWVEVGTAWDSTTASLTVGDTETDDVDRWKGATDLKVLALAAITAPGPVIPTSEAITATVTFTGVPTVGKATVYIEYVEQNRSTEFMTRRA